MALTSGTIFQSQASATTGNTGGAGFNPTNANMLTDLATDANTANTSAPIVSSVSYNFRTGGAGTGDVGAWLYVKSGTSWQAGWYQIASVASNKATLTAGVGTAVLTIDAAGTVTLNTSAGCTSDNTATLTGGTFTIDYSQQDTADTTATDFTAVGASTTLTSATAAFRPVMVGNFFHQTTTGTGAHGTTGWYEIVSYTNATTIVTDRTTNDGTASVACTGFVGGAGRLNGLEDAFFEMIPASSIVWVKNGSYTISGAISIASSNSSNASPSMIMGFNTIRGDTCTGSNRPVITCAANATTFGQAQILKNLTFTTTSAAGVVVGASAYFVNCKVTNTSTTASRVALASTGADSSIIDCEAVSQNGTAATLGSTRVKAFGCYCHDSVTGMSSTGTTSINDCIFEANSTDAISLTSTAGSNSVSNNTVYGREAKMGNGLNLNANPSPVNRVISNIFYGLATGINVSTATQGTNFGTKNDFYNNTTDVTNYTKSADALAVDPVFTGATQITGSTATTSGSTLSQSGGDFSTVTDSVDYLRVTSGTGVNTGGYLIISHTSNSLTVNNVLGTSSGGDVNYFVTTGHNFQIGTNLKAAAFPSFANVGSETTSYLDVGAVQRQEPSGGATSNTFS